MTARLRGALLARIALAAIVLSSLNSARNTFGPPARIYSYRQYTVLVWGKNLLAGLG